MTSDYSARLTTLVRERGTSLVLGLDPRPAWMPARYAAQGGDGITAFHEKLIELCAPYVVGIKPQIAFFEALGVEGLARYAETCALGREAGLVVIGDVKRGDIGSTAEAYASAHFEWADALTLHPYLGGDSIEPFLTRCRDSGRGVFVLTVTSNASWSEFQDIRDADGVPVYVRVAEAVDRWNATCSSDAGFGPVGCVVGATHPEVLARVRATAPKSWLLLPGVGAQGANVGDLSAGLEARGRGALLPVSRGLASCFDPADDGWEGKVVAAAKQLVAEIRAAVPALTG
jgi:orotidine 5'-phosphate decarboxylase subfamily 2